MLNCLNLTSQPFQKPGSVFITPDDDIILPSYNNKRRDRVGDRYGGLIIYIKMDFITGIGRT